MRMSLISLRCSGLSSERESNMTKKEALAIVLESAHYEYQNAYVAMQDEDSDKGKALKAAIDKLSKGAN